MPRNVASHLSPEELRNVVAFLASLGAFPDYKEIVHLEIPDARRPTPERLHVKRHAMELADHVMREKGQCFECHAMHSHPEYRVFAPGLFGVGLIDRKSIHDSLVKPHAKLTPNYAQTSVTLKRGTVVTGQLISRHPEHLVMAVWDGRGRLIPQRIELADVSQADGEFLIEPSDQSPMPAGFEQSLSQEEQDAVITLIQLLN
jgi:hypothetical protein